MDQKKVIKFKANQIQNKFKANIYDRGSEYNYVVNTVQTQTENCQKIAFRQERYSSYTDLLSNVAWVIKITKTSVYRE